MQSKRSIIMNEEIELFNYGWDGERDYPKKTFHSCIVKEMAFWDQCLLIMANNFEAANEVDVNETK